MRTYCCCISMGGNVTNASKNASRSTTRHDDHTLLTFPTILVCLADVVVGMMVAKCTRNSLVPARALPSFKHARTCLPQGDTSTTQCSARNSGVTRARRVLRRRCTCFFLNFSSIWDLKTSPKTDLEQTNQKLIHTRYTR